ncbi:NAD-dependent epimerase/dehydratase family protein [Sediminitomix flava]|uniref:Dihydroflavonol-4-reductase n=1 Tax=Sediminitomix flava TaxID=379075 RepID=A0A315ZBX9_SEDFL|nr:NAD-dependent epimerase/dehydratase family protein [Sediminitomix flava]PWJ42298.1 dihydroflavonol-4-reductase [Sediminitomix flava]
MLHKKQRVLVTGANGFLGANIIQQLQDMEQYQAVAMVRKGCNMLALDGLAFEIYEGEITSLKDLESIISTCDFVIHVAALTKPNENDFSVYQKINVETTSNIINLCLKYKVKRLVFVSTANCFTNGSLDQPGDEAKGFMSWLKSSNYAYSKHLAQENVLNAVRDDNLDATIVAPTFMIGERDAGPSSGVLLLYGLKKSIVFYPPGGKSFVSVTEVAKSSIKALKVGKAGESYLLSGKNLTYHSFFKEIGALSGEKKLMIPIPRFLFVFLMLMANAFEALTNKRTVFNSSNIKLLFLDNYFSNEKAKKALGMKDTDLSVSLKEGISWYKRNSYV